jgi:hypothetical protein
LWARWRGAQNEQQMTISYPDETVLKALLLARGNDTLQVTVRGDDDVRTFTLIKGTWISEECEPVKIEAGRHPCEGVEVPNETECVCSKELSSRLMSMLLAGTEGDDLLENMLYLSSTDSHGVRGVRRCP